MKPATYANALLLLCACPLAAQLSVSGELVLVPTTIMGGERHIVQAADMQLSVDRARVPIAAFWRDAGPISVVIVFDVSRSMKPAMAKARVAIEGLLGLAEPEDDYALVLCHDRAEIALPFTRDVEQVKRVVLAAQASGATSLYDAIQIALGLVREGAHPRKLILVLSDSEDTGSRATQLDVENRAIESEAIIYALQFWNDRPVTSIGRSPLQDLARLTGGPYLEDASPRQLPDPHERYMLAFRPPRDSAPGKRHRIELKVANSRARISYRRTFISRPE